jgi:hypothetical protein
MRRPRLLALTAAVVASGCAPVYDVAVSWTIAGLEPTAACSALPEGTDVAFTITSRDNADERFGGTVTETTATAACNAGAATIQTGNFADILVTLKNGDETIGSAPAIAVSPGSASRGFVDGALPASVDLTVLQGTLNATLTVGARSCGDAGASAFTVSLFEAAEPNALVAVDGAVDVEVPCTDGVATFTFSPVHLGSAYRVQATTTIGDVEYTTASFGEGITPTAPATFMTVDLQSR